MILLGLTVHSRLDDDTPGVQIPAPNYALVYAVTAIAPAYCALTRQGLANVAWWGFALVAVVLHDFFRSLILQGRKDILRLETLKYDARGA